MIYPPTVQPGNLHGLECGKCGNVMLIEKRERGKPWPDNGAYNDWLCETCGIRYRIRDTKVPYEFITTGVSKTPKGTP